MDSLSIFILKILRKLYAKAFGGCQLPPLQREEDPDKASDIIYNLLMQDKPCMIARFGAFELATIANYLGIQSKEHSIWKYIRSEQEQWWWNKKLISYMQSNAGFFPSTPENLQRFGKLMVEDMKELDILESWRPEEAQLKNYLPHCVAVTAEIMGPYFLKNPWTKALKGKKVLVVHPFAQTIQNQYKKRTHLFRNPNVLPEFELKAIKAVQSIGGNSNFKDWFEALGFMKSQINAIEFDICIVGCGAYGFPIAAHVKRIGKKAVHLAGMTQLLFGIWGARWDKDNYSKYNYKALRNEFWVRPDESEKPASANNVEGGCYW